MSQTEAGASQAIEPEQQVFTCLGDLVAYYGRTRPDAPAILAPEGTPLSYGALWAQTNEVVSALRSFGISRTDRVAVVLPSGADAATATLAVAIGSVCVPLHPGFAADEWRRYFGDLNVAALLTSAEVDSSCRTIAYSLGIPVIDLLRQPEQTGRFSLSCTAARVAAVGNWAAGTDDAFMLLTSGTTSRPKLVPLTHASICQSAFNAGVALALRPQDRLLNVLPLFHAHGLISAVLTALAAGSSVICTPGFDAASFFGWLKELRPTWYTAVPTIHRALLSAAAHKHGSQRFSLRIIRSASASLPPDILKGLESRFGVPVIETYGMTEATSQIAANPRERRKVGSVGRATGPEIAIIDSDGRPLQASRPGEIVLRGPTIAREYYNDTAATKSAFQDGWFRTGDLGYLDADGYLFVSGRLKKADVINRGGQKVSPAEVESVLLSHPDVTAAAVFPVPHVRLGEDVGAAVVLRPNARTTGQKLRRFASEHLARFKIPGQVWVVPRIPAGPGGKLVRGELARKFGLTSPRTRLPRDATILAPRSETEWLLAQSWADLLEIKEIGVDQDVFALGADSLTVGQMLSRLRERFGVDLSFRDILDAPTVAALSICVESSKRKHPAASVTSHARAEDSWYPLSLQQQSIYLLSNLDPIDYKYHVVSVARLSGQLDPAVLEACIATICERHEILGSIFAERSGRPMQLATTIRPVLERLDLGPLPPRKVTAAIQSHICRLLQQPFDIERQPPIRAQLLKLGENDHALGIKLHHLLTDGWSQRLFWEELEALYEGKTKGLPARLPELPAQYGDFVAWQSGWLQTATAEQQLNYWRARLEGLTELPLRTDHPRPATRTGRGARLTLKLSRKVSRGIRRLSRSHNATVFMTLLAAFKCLLHRYTEHDDIAVGSLIANRTLLQTERLIGMFANTIVLRTDVSGDPTFSEVLHRVRRVTLDAYSNQDLPIEEILQALRVPRSQDRNPLFQVMLILQKASSKGPALAGSPARFVEVDPGVARADILLELTDAGKQSLDGWIEYSTELFDPATITRMAAHFQTLLESIVANPEERLSRLSLLPEWERKRVVIDWNQARSRSHGGSGSFPQRFARQVKRSPDAVAVSAGEVRLSYRELADRASAIVDLLCAQAVRRDEVVVLFADRGVAFLAAMVALQLAGGAVLPSDPGLPSIRLAQIIQHSGARVVLAAQNCLAALQMALSKLSPKARPRVLILDKIGKSKTKRRRRVVAGAIRRASADLACVIYTSGSTGTPKGAMIEHRGLFNHLLSKVDDTELSASDVVAQTSPQSFVIVLWQLLAPLIVGSRVHICADGTVRDPPLLMQEVSREGVTVLEIVPALLREILRPSPSPAAFHALSRLRSLISTGETLPSDLCQDWFRHFPNVPLINAYGSTECSDDVATHCLTAPPASAATVPIGRPIANIRLYVLDHHLQPAPIGVAGELYVGGIGVGRGYLKDAEQTRHSFLRDPFSKSGRGRLYRTGDLARWRADGTLECFGRVDHQVKIRGCRIELEEVGHALTGYPDVQSAVVLARDNIGGETQLIAYVCAAGKRPKASGLRDFLKARLPTHMIPAGYVFLDQMPLTAHGKLDRSALAALELGFGVTDDEHVPPRNATEEVLARIWRELLGVDEIGIHNNFFDLGGHSLLAGRVLARVADVCGVSLPIRAMFEASTVEALARRIDQALEARSIEPAVDLACAKGPVTPMSSAQERLLRMERELPGLPRFNLASAYRLKGPMNVQALEQSLAELVRRHSSLRTGFAWADERPVALVTAAADISSPLVVEDLASQVPSVDDRSKALLLKKAELMAEEEAWTSFDVARAPLFRARLLRLDADDHILLLVVHHIIIDGWSMGIFIEELSALYSAFAARRQPQLPGSVPQFSDFANRQRSWLATGSATRQFSYWKEHLQDAAPVFPKDHDSGEMQLDSPIAHQPIHLPHELVARLNALSSSRGGTLFMTLLAGFKAMLLARTGRNDICVATAMANRHQLTMERMIGPLQNTTLVRTRIGSDLSFQEALCRVRDSVLEAHSRQEFPFDILATRLEQEEGLDPASLIQVYFAFQNKRQPLELPGVVVRSFGNEYRSGQPVLPIDRTWLTVMLRETSSGVIGSCSYKSDFLKTDDLKHWIEDYEAILTEAAANPETPLGRLANR